MNILDFIFPKRCVGCGMIGKYICGPCCLRVRYVAKNESICPVCEKLAIDGATHPRCRMRYGVDGLTSFFRYDGPIRKAVKVIKYRLISDLVTEFVLLAPYTSMSSIPTSDMLIPIPLHVSRLRSRGFNQSEALGRVLAGELRIPVAVDILRRVTGTTPQVEMHTRAERLGNMKNVFQAVRTIRNKNILLFDDVFTTGATMRAAANVLKRAGAKCVWAVTMAR